MMIMLDRKAKGDSRSKRMVEGLGRRMGGKEGEMEEGK